MKYIFIICCWAMLSITTTAQIVNNGASITLSSGATLATLNNITNQNGGQIINNGRIATKKDINNDANSSIGGNGNYEVEGSWMNEGTYDPGTSTVTIGGANGNCTVTTSTAGFYHLQIDCIDGGELQLMDNLTVSSQLEMMANNNKIRLGNHQLIIPTTNLTGFDNQNYIITDGTGAVERRIGPAFGFLPIGADENTYNPIFLTQGLEGNGDAIAETDIKVRCFPQVLSGGYSGTPLTDNAVDAMWEITSPTDFKVGASFQWEESDELTGFDRSQVAVAYHDGDNWNLGTPQVASSQGTTHSTQADDLVEPTVYALMSNAGLPLELLDFTAKPLNNDALLQWQTATELAFSHFEIERSTDGQQWQFIFKIPAKGSDQSYRYFDKKVADVSPTLYYRLKMVDKDGSFTYSPVRTVHFSDKNTVAAISASPNPFSGQTTLYFSLPDGFAEAAVHIIDPLGRVVRKIDLTDAALNQMVLSAVDLAAGMYSYTLFIDGAVVDAKQLILTK